MQHQLLFYTNSSAGNAQQHYNYPFSHAQAWQNATNPWSNACMGRHANKQNDQRKRERRKG
jgi:hypothetical protein